jgi:hypothetical protein
MEHSSTIEVTRGTVPRLPSSLTTVTRLSKALAVLLFIALPFLGFWIGMRYQEEVSTQGQGLLCDAADTCCTTSLQTINENQYLLRNGDTLCPQGYEPSMLRCATSLRWCAPVTQSPKDVDMPPIEEFTDDTNSQAPVIEGTCGVSNCHGLAITCSIITEPVMCTMMYQVGDGCRQFATCGVIDGECGYIPSRQFESCKTCVESCEATQGGGAEDVLACESACVESAR